MEFGWINIFGWVLLLLMLAPNVLYALHRDGGKKRRENRWMNGLEQVGRYASMALMVFPVGVRKFGFPNVAAMLGYLLGNSALVAVYWLYWLLYFREATKERARMLAVIPACIFLLSGLMLRHWLLVAAAGVFGVAHISVTLANHT